MSRYRARRGRRVALASAVGVALAMVLASCTIPIPTGSGPKTSEATPSQSTSSQAAPTSSSPSPGAEASGTTGTGAGGVLGGFGSMSDACVSVSAAMVSVAVLPLAGLLGGKPEDVAKAQEELAMLQGRLPEELKPHFAKLKAFTDSAGSDFSKYGTGEFEALMKPIQDWLDKNCS